MRWVGGNRTVERFSIRPTRAANSEVGRLCWLFAGPASSGARLFRDDAVKAEGCEIKRSDKGIDDREPDCVGDVVSRQSPQAEALPEFDPLLR